MDSFEKHVSQSISKYKSKYPGVASALERFVLYLNNPHHSSNKENQKKLKPLNLGRWDCPYYSEDLLTTRNIEPFNDCYSLELVEKFKQHLITPTDLGFFDLAEDAKRKLFDYALEMFEQHKDLGKNEVDKLLKEYIIFLDIYSDEIYDASISNLKLKKYDDSQESIRNKIQELFSINTVFRVFKELEVFERYTIDSENDYNAFWGKVYKYLGEKETIEKLARILFDEKIESEKLEKEIHQQKEKHDAEILEIQKLSTEKMREDASTIIKGFQLILETFNPNLELKTEEVLENETEKNTGSEKIYTAKLKIVNELKEVLIEWFGFKSQNTESIKDLVENELSEIFNTKNLTIAKIEQLAQNHSKLIYKGFDYVLFYLIHLLRKEHRFSSLSQIANWISNNFLFTKKYEIIQKTAGSLRVNFSQRVYSEKRKDEEGKKGFIKVPPKYKRWEKEYYGNNNIP